MLEPIRHSRPASFGSTRALRGLLRYTIDRASPGATLAEAVETFEKEALLPRARAEAEALACTRDPLCGAAAIGLREESRLACWAPS